MANNDGRKITGYLACTAPEANGFLVFVGNTAGTKNNFTLTPNTLFNNTAVNVTVLDGKTLSANAFIVRKNLTPTTSGDTVTKGSFWWDANYLYIATANNTIKRVALSSF